MDSARPPKPRDNVDYATPEAEEAFRAAMAMVLELRREVRGPLARKIRLYERTLGLAVAPTLVRQAFRRWRRSRAGGHRAP